MRGVDECPDCGTGGEHVMHLKVRGEPAVGICKLCGTAWETFDPADLAVEGDTYGPFKSPCDNCAWRKGSPERSNPETWDDLMIRIKIGEAVFYCHKGVPIGDGEDGQSHVHPRKPDGTWDQDKMRECAGWLLTRLAGLRKEANRA